MTLYGAKYTIYLRNDAGATPTLVSEFNDYSQFTALKRFNAIGAWQLDLSSTNAVFATLQAAKASGSDTMPTAINQYGIVVIRTVTNLDSGAEVDNRVFFSGPIWGFHREKDSNVANIHGFCDAVWLATRLAMPQTDGAYETYVETLPNIKRNYRLDTGDSGTTALDSALGQNGTGNAGATPPVVADPLVALVDDFGVTALSGYWTFNGTNGKITVPTTGLPTGNGAWWLLCWFQVSAYPGTQRTLMSFGAFVTKDLGAISMTSSGGILGDTGGSNTAASSAVSLNTPHMAVVTYDGTTLRCFVDGVQTATATPGTMGISLTAARIGCQMNDSAFFPGVIAHAIFGGGATIPSAAQITNAYNYGVSRFSFQAYDTQAGASSATIAHYTQKNADISNFTAPDSNGYARAFAHWSVAGSSGGVGSGSGNARFRQLYSSDPVNAPGLVQELAQEGKVRLRTTYGSSRSYNIENWTDRSIATGDGSCVFSDQQTAVEDWSEDYDLATPDSTQGNVVYVLGGGTLTSRSIVTMGNKEAEQRIECAIDASDTTDHTTLLQRGQQILDATGQGIYQFGATITPGTLQIYGKDFEVGDMCTVVVNQTSRTVQITDVSVQLTPTSQGTGGSNEVFNVGVATVGQVASLSTGGASTKAASPVKKVANNAAARLANKERNV